MRIDFGMQWICTYASRNLTIFSEPVLLVSKTDGNFEYRSTATKMKTFFPFSPCSGLAKSNCNSSLGAERGGSGSEVLDVLDDFFFLPNFVHSMNI